MDPMETQMDEQSRRSFLKRAAYVTPLILSLKAESAFASYGSGNPDEETERQSR